jgi:acyl-CoA hydrolase
MSWQDDYKKKVKGPADALACVRPEMRVYIHPGCAEPETLVEALIARAPDLHDVEIVHLMTMGTADYIAPEMEGHFRHNAMFIGGNVREAVNDGRADYTPVFLSEIEGLFKSGKMPLDVALIQVSPPDSHGFCSFGVGVDTTLTAATWWRRSTSRCPGPTATASSTSATSIRWSKSTGRSASCPA